MKWRTRLLRAAVLLVVAGLLTRLLFESSLLRLLDASITPGSIGAWVFAAICLALVPAVFAGGSPLSLSLAAATPILMASSYGASHLEWLKTLKEFHLGEDAPLAADRVLVAALAIALLWALHVADTGIRIASDAEGRGIGSQEALAARRVVWSRGARAGGLALALAAALGFLAFLAGALLPGLLPSQGLAFAAPLAAAALLGVAALVILGVRKRGAPPTADDSLD